MKESDKQSKESTHSAKSVTTREEYDKLFSKNREEALRIALEERKFQIEQYWRKIIYYWSLLGAIFIGFFSLQNSNIDEVKLYSVFTSGLGFIVSIAWYLMNRSGAFWHFNWDAHVHELELYGIGPLHRTRLNSSLFPFKNIALPYRTASTKVNTIVSFYVCFLWVFLFLYTLLDLFQLPVPPFFYGILLAAINLFFIFVLVSGTKFGSGKIEFRIEGQTLDSE